MSKNNTIFPLCPHIPSSPAPISEQFENKDALFNDSPALQVPAEKSTLFLMNDSYDHVKISLLLPGVARELMMVGLSEDEVVVRVCWVSKVVGAYMEGRFGRTGLEGADEGVG